MIRAFVSSTYRDLKDHRAHVIRRLRKSGVFVDPMEDWTAATDEPKDLSQDRVKGCDVCILLVGFRRGHVPGGQGPSITQMEFQEALKQRIEVLAFMADEEADWPAGAFSELDDEMKRWRSDLREHHDVERFTPAPESIDVQSALFRWWDKAKDAGERTALDLPADGGAFPLEIRACSNSEGVLIAWRTLEPIAGCQGFALHRRTLGEAAVTEDIVATGLGFSPAGVGRHAPSTVWPIQNFRWTDYPSGQTAPDRAAAPEVRYRVSAMLGETGNLRESETISSGWTRWVSRRTGQTPGLRAYFNPGTGWSAGLARAHAKKEPGDLSLLGGELRRRLLDLLGTARRLEQRVYVAVSALDDGEVIAALKALGPRLYILLGPVGAAVCDELLAGSVNLYHRVLKPPRRASNNFAVFCDRWGAPVQVWTGSGAWTSRALCLRSNHAILADSAELALAYRDRWDVLRDAGGACTRRLLQASSRPAQVTLGGASITL